MTLPEPVADGVQALHEDDDLLVLCKPSGLLCVPGRGPDKQDCLSARALIHKPNDVEELCATVQRLVSGHDPA